MPMKNPPHPGDFIPTEIIEPAGLSVTAAAAALRVSRPTLSSLLDGKAGLSGNMALRIEKAFLDMSGQGPAFIVGPAFLGVLRFQSAAEYVFNARIAAAGKAFVDERLKVRWDV